MKLAAFLLLAQLASCAAVAPAGPGPAAPPPYENRFALYLGQRSLDEDDWEPVEDQLTLGFDYSHEAAGSAIGFEVGLFASGDDEEVAGADVEGPTLELSAGIRKTFAEGSRIRPYLGAGVAVINAEAEVGGSDDDTSLAGYAHGGLGYQISDTFVIGVDLRVLFGSDLEIAGVDTDADYGQLALVLAVAF